MNKPDGYTILKLKDQGSFPLDVSTYWGVASRDATVGVTVETIQESRYDQLRGCVYRMFTANPGTLQYVVGALEPQGEELMVPHISVANVSLEAASLQGFGVTGLEAQYHEVPSVDCSLVARAGSNELVQHAQRERTTHLEKAQGELALVIGGHFAELTLALAEIGGRYAIASLMPRSEPFEAAPAAIA